MAYGNPFQSPFTPVTYTQNDKSANSWMSALGANGQGIGALGYAGMFGTPTGPGFSQGPANGPAAQNPFAQPSSQFAGSAGMTGTARPNSMGGLMPRGIMAGGENPFGSTGIPTMSDIAGAGMSDIQRSQSAADRQYQMKAGLNTQFGQAVLGNNQRLTDQLGTLNTGLDQAEAQYQQGITDYTDRTAQSASAMAAGITRNAKTAMQQAMSGLRADGSQKTQQEIDADVMAIHQGVNGQIQESLAPLYDSYNQAKAGMTQNLAAFKAQNQLQRNAALLNAVNYDLQGRGAQYQQVTQNPETVVGKFDTYLALANVADAARGRAMAGGGGGGGMSMFGGPQSAPAISSDRYPSAGVGVRSYGEPSMVETSRDSTQRQGTGGTNRNWMDQYGYPKNA